MDPRTSLPRNEADVAGDYPFAEQQGGGQTRLRPLPLAPTCHCTTQTEMGGDDGRAYQREHLVWVRHLGDDVNLWVCADGLALWDDGTHLDSGDALSRIWLTTGDPMRPMLAYSAARGW